MGYLHIENLYRPEAQKILDFKRLYVLEKIHGTSAHVAIAPGGLRFFAGGESYDSFRAIFGTHLPPAEEIEAKMREMFGDKPTTIFGEAYGGRCQGMRKTYGERLSFVAFDVRCGDTWLDVPNAADVCAKIGIPFVWYDLVASDLPTLDAARDRPSEQAKRNGVEGDHPMEGVVVRPPYEVTLSNGSRLIAKHKRPEFSERKSIPEVDPTKREIMEKADAIADEWVTEMRLTHVLDKLGNPSDFKDIPRVIEAMIEDVFREASGEIVDSKAARKSIGSKAVQLFKGRIMAIATKEPT